MERVTATTLLHQLDYLHQLNYPHHLHHLHQQNVSTQKKCLNQRIGELDRKLDRPERPGAHQVQLERKLKRKHNHEFDIVQEVKRNRDERVVVDVAVVNIFDFHKLFLNCYYVGNCMCVI